MRVRVGIAQVSSGGVIRKPKGEVPVERYVLKKFTKTEHLKLDKVIENAVSAIETVVSKGRDTAMGQWN